MTAQDDNTAPSRTGMRRIIPRFEFRRLHAMARVRIGAGSVLVGLGVITLVRGSFTAEAFAWAAFFLVLGALQFSVGYWYLAIIRSAHPRT
jgi:multisubunit Na+/H+ antiporter MnhG subunit